MMLLPLYLGLTFIVNSNGESLLMIMGVILLFSLFNRA